MCGEIARINTRAWGDGRNLPAVEVGGAEDDRWAANSEPFASMRGSLSSDSSSDMRFTRSLYKLSAMEPAAQVEIAALSYCAETPAFVHFSGA